MQLNEKSITLSKRRSPIEIMTSILRAARKQRRDQLQTDGGVAINKRALMRAANLNHTQLGNYLDTLDQKQFLIRRETDAGLDLEITEKGEELLARTEALSELLQD